MRYNIEIIESSEILKAIVKNIENNYPNDIAILLCYGSYVTKCHNRLSDIDFCFVPKNDKGKEVSKQFIIDGIGYDLWPVSWGRFESMASLDNSFGSIIMDGKILYAASEAESKRIEELRTELKKNLLNDEFSKSKAKNFIDKSKIEYFGTMQSNPTAVYIAAQKAIENIIVAMAIMNGMYLKKGLKSINDEIIKYKYCIEKISEKYRKIIFTENLLEVSSLVYGLISEIEILWKKIYVEETPKNNHDLSGFFEEFKSTYNKLVYECENKNYEKAYYAAYMIDKETLETIQPILINSEFPSMITNIKKHDYVHMKAVCDEHENILVSKLKDIDIIIEEYADINEFIKCYNE